MVSFLFFQCHQDWNETPKEKIIEPNFPVDIKQWGESVASKLNCVITEAKQRNTLKSIHVISLENANSEIFDDFNTSLSEFSKNQLNILKLIAVARSESDSYIEFSNNLSEINDKIYKTVPKAEQEKLFYITSALYYGLKEINELVKRGFIYGNPEGVTNNTVSELKSSNALTFAPPGLEFNYCTEVYDWPDRIPENCKTGSWWKNPDILATLWAVGLIEPTPVGEAVALIATGIVGSYLIITRAECVNKYVHCKMYSSRTDCDNCLHYCVVQGYWNCN